VKSLVSKRSIVIASHKTSVSLEDEFWNSFKGGRRRARHDPCGAGRHDRWQSSTCQSIVSYSTFCAWRLSRSASLKRVDAVRQIGASEVTYYRWREEFDGLKTEQVKRLKD
jgi:hypothetical protein